MSRYPFDVATVGEAVRQPPLADLADRAGRQVRRRRVLTGAIAAVVAVGVPAGAGLARRDRDRRDRAAGAASGTPRDTFTDAVAVGGASVVAVRWNRCAVTVSVTGDAGARWTPFRGPVPWRDCGIPAAAGTTITNGWEVLGPGVVAVTVDDRRYLTRDGGASWRLHDHGVTVVDALPAGVRLLDEPAVTAVDLATATRYQLGGAGPSRDVWSVRMPEDGSLWTVGSDLDHRPADTPVVPRVLVSVDRGLTWRATGPLPAVATDSILVPVSGRRAYLVTTRDRPAVVYRIDDALIWSAHPAPWRTAQAATTGADGVLLVCGLRPDGTTAVWVSHDGGASFVEGPPPPLVPARPARAGAGLAWVVDDAGRTAVTTDGRGWRRVAAPRR